MSFRKNIAYRYMEDTGLLAKVKLASNSSSKLTGKLNDISVITTQVVHGTREQAEAV